MTNDLIPNDVTTTSLIALREKPEAPQPTVGAHVPTFGLFPPSKAKVAIIDDQPTNVAVLEEYLKQDGYERLIGSSDSTSAVSLIVETNPDIVLLDVNMPHVDGHAVLRGVRANPDFVALPVLMLTASDDSDTRRLSFELGATDFLSKPIDPGELILRVRNALALRHHQQQLADYASQLESLVRQRTEQLHIAQREAIHCLAKASEYRDHETGCHVLRVGRYSALIARQLGKSDDYAEVLELAATLHDIGKIAVPDAILLKSDKLEEDEYAWMQRHCVMGSRMCRTVGPEEAAIFRTHAEAGLHIIEASTSPIMKLAARIAQTHHEKWNGTGYPLGLQGEDIPLEGRIVAIADVFDALSTKRPYKPAFPIKKCFEILQEERGEHFDPEVVDAFMARKDEIVEIQIEYSDE